jgi:hypothetical protein
MATIVVMSRPGRAPNIDERRFVPNDLEEARQLRRALVMAGTPRAVARGCVMWLIELGEVERPVSRGERVQGSRYRRELFRLGKPPFRRPEPIEYVGAKFS